MSNIKEHERVVLTADVAADGLAYEVEFTTLDGHTAAVVTLEAAQVRPVGHREITHARALAA